MYLTFRTIHRNYNPRLLAGSTGARMSSKLTRIADSPNPDGSHDVTIDHNGQEIAANIPVQRVQELIANSSTNI